jgi:hypothetical protein
LFYPVINIKTINFDIIEDNILWFEQVPDINNIIFEYYDFTPVVLKLYDCYVTELLPYYILKYINKDVIIADSIDYIEKLREDIIKNREDPRRRLGYRSLKNILNSSVCSLFRPLQDITNTFSQYYDTKIEIEEEFFLQTLGLSNVNL